MAVIYREPAIGAASIPMHAAEHAVSPVCMAISNGNLRHIVQACDSLTVIHLPQNTDARLVMQASSMSVEVLGNFVFFKREILRDPSQYPAGMQVNAASESRPSQLNTMLRRL